MHNEWNQSKRKWDVEPRITKETRDQLQVILSQHYGSSGSPKRVCKSRVKKFDLWIGRWKGVISESNHIKREDIIAKLGHGR